MSYNIRPVSQVRGRIEDSIYAVSLQWDRMMTDECGMAKDSLSHRQEMVESMGRQKQVRTTALALVQSSVRALT